MPHPDEDDLALLALGETVPGASEHVRGCAQCEREVRVLTATVDTARRADLSDLPAPPAQVWDRIAGELSLAPDPVEVPPGRVRPRRSPWSGRLVAAGAVLVATAAAVVVGIVLGSGGQPEAPPLGATAPLVALGTVDAEGRVVLSADPARRSLLVDTSGLPRADGFYEVWLLDLDRDRLVALGALDDSGSGWLTVPDGVRISDYPLVDVSLEPDDGDPGHSGNSVLRGDVPA